MKEAIWVTWENQIRNRSMTTALSIPLYIINYKTSRIIRYILCIVKTFLLLIKEKPKVVFAQNPSVILNLFLLILRPIFQFKILSDAHFGGVEAYNGSRIFQKILDYNNRCMDAVIVTNMEHARHIERVGGKAFVCEDPLPDLSRFYKPNMDGEKNVFFICSYAIDEPYTIAFDAARLLFDEGYRFHVSGNYQKVGIDPKMYPHIHFLGFVSESEFYKTLFQSQVVLDLTSRENCLVCGAYEAMSALKPLVTSDRLVLRQYFNRGTVFSEHNLQSIADSVRYAYENRDILEKEIHMWVIQSKDDIANKITNIREFILREK